MLDSANVVQYANELSMTKRLSCTSCFFFALLSIGSDELRRTFKPMRIELLSGYHLLRGDLSIYPNFSLRVPSRELCYLHIWNKAHVPYRFLACNTRCTMTLISLDFDLNASLNIDSSKRVDIPGFAVSASTNATSRDPKLVISAPF